MPGDAFQHTDGKVGVGVFQPLVRLKVHPHLVRHLPLGLFATGCNHLQGNGERWGDLDRIEPLL